MMAATPSTTVIHSSAQAGGTDARPYWFEIHLEMGHLDHTHREYTGRACERTQSSLGEELLKNLDHAVTSCTGQGLQHLVGLFGDPEEQAAEEAQERHDEAQERHDEEHCELLLKIIPCLCSHPAINDTIWLSEQLTVVESLAAMASDLGATDEQIEAACTVPVETLYAEQTPEREQRGDDRTVPRLLEVLQVITRAGIQTGADLQLDDGTEAGLVVRHLLSDMGASEAQIAAVQQIEIEKAARSAERAVILPDESDHMHEITGGRWLQNATLLPCPHCGSQTIAQTQQPPWRITCIVCHSQTRGSTKGECVNKWSTRSVREWTDGDMQAEMVHAYLALMCNMSEARQHISHDLRETLATALVS